jgi:sugar phosphate isomerase/epimerase
VADVSQVLEEYPSPRLGACVDTGHYLRSGQAPDEVIPVLGDRVNALHLKDFDNRGVGTVPGDGRVDLGRLLELLEEFTAFDRPFVVEYEADPEDPTPAVLEAAEALTNR